jgi:hypothetical protein
MKQYFTGKPTLFRKENVIRSFPSNRFPKMRERHQLFFGLQRMSKEFQHSEIQTKIEQHFGGFFHYIKVHLPIRRQEGFYRQTVIRGWIHFCMKDLEPFKYSRSKIKNKKTVAVDVLIKAYPMLPLSCRSNLPGQ